MKTFYVAAIVPERQKDGGGLSVYIPDVPGAVTCGQTIEEAVFMAEDVLRLTLQDLAAEKKAIPAPSPLARVRERVQAIRREDGLDYPADEVVFQYVPAPSLDMVPVKITVSLPKAVLEEVDAKAKACGYTRSGFLAHAAQAWQPERC